MNELRCPRKNKNGFGRHGRYGLLTKVHTRPIGLQLKPKKSDRNAFFNAPLSRGEKKKCQTSRVQTDVLRPLCNRFRRIWFRNLRAIPVWLPWRDPSVHGTGRCRQHAVRATDHAFGFELTHVRDRFDVHNDRFRRCAGRLASAAYLVTYPSVRWIRAATLHCCNVVLRCSSTSKSVRRMIVLASRRVNGISSPFSSGHSCSSKHRLDHDRARPKGQKTKQEKGTHLMKSS